MLASVLFSHVLALEKYSVGGVFVDAKIYNTIFLCRHIYSERRCVSYSNPNFIFA